MLVEKNKASIHLSIKDFEECSIDGGSTTFKLLDYLNNKNESEKTNVSLIDRIVLDDPNLLLKFLGIWVPATIIVSFIITETYYLKYIRPDEYSQLRDHIRDEIVPLNLLVQSLKLDLDEDYIEVKKDDIPIFTNFNFRIEESLTPLKDPKLIKIQANKVDKSN